MQNKIEYFLFISFSYFFKLIGLKLTRKFSIFIAFFFYYIIPIRKQTVFDNLKYAFPDFDTKTIKKISFENYKSFALTFTEIMFIPFISRQMLIDQVECENLEIVNNYHKKGIPVILLTAHFGNWEFMAASTGVQVGFPLYVVIKNQRNPYVTEWMKYSRTKFGNEVIPLGVQIRNVYEKLKEKQIIVMAADQRGDEDGLRVNMFNRKTAVFPGPASLALRTNSKLILSIPIRQKNNSYKIIFNELSLNNLPEDEESKKIEICQRYIAYLENIIRKHPEQWLWMHKRWKH